MEAVAETTQAEGTTDAQSQGPLVALLALLIIATIGFPSFRTADNLANVARQVSMIGVVSIGMAFVILSGGIDLSVGSTAAVAALLAARFSGGSALATVGIPILVGVGIGASNGVLITRLAIPPFTATLAMMLGARGVAFIMAGEKAVVRGASTGWLPEVARGAVLGVPYFAVIFVSVLLAAAAVSRYTRFGRSVYAVGGNEEAARMMGLGVRRCKMLVYMISGGCAGAAGILFAARTTSVKPGAAGGWELAAIAAVVISGISLAGGIGKVGHVVYGVLILGIIPNVINKLPFSLPTYSNDLITGILLLAVVLLQARIAHSDSR
ncbi:ABC transporter permease [bacterium]|nr:ABC transporter permease [bacterium]